MIKKWIAKLLSRRRRPARNTMDMTSGPMLKNVVLFAWPLMLTGILQLLFNAADMIVVGRYSGAQAPQALAAVGSTSSLINLLVNVFMGMSVGASVLVAQRWGARDQAAVSRAVHTAITVALFSSVIVGAVGVIFAKPLLKMMDNPDDVIDLAALYMRIYFLGMPANLLYNFGAAVLRAVGDTRRPLYYVTIAGAANVLLNLLLVIVFHLSVAGVAIATVVSQTISAVLVVLCLHRTHSAIHLDFKRLRIHAPELKAIVRVGLPAGLQGSLFSISNVLIQSSVNGFGSIAMAGNTSASNLEGFIYTSMNSVYQADLTFTSQNYGAGKADRVRRVMWVCLGTVTVIGLSMGLLFLALGPQLLSFYNGDPEVIKYGLMRMTIIMPTYFLCGMMDTMVGQLRGVGCSILPMIVSLSGACLLRIVWIYTVFAQPAYHSLNVLYISYPISWGVTFLIHLACWYAVRGRALAKITGQTPALYEE